MLMEWLQVIGMIIGVLIGLSLFVGLVGFYANNAGMQKAAPSTIEGWAIANGYQIRAIESKTHRYQPISLIYERRPRILSKSFGPHVGEALLSDDVYRVVVTKIGEEKRRVAWIRLGAELTVVWEDEMQDPPIEGF
ncbi:MAG: hypothetical protein K8L91_03285 [Anaerolineae bacterium]|nr:hypothetical protein [Anaerolineae bacterium]